MPQQQPRFPSGLAVVVVPGAVPVGFEDDDPARYGEYATQPGTVARSVVEGTETYVYVHGWAWRASDIRPLI